MNPLFPRIGFGHDSHIFDKSGQLRLGGLSLSKAPKLRANSDGDAVLHALTNAISSAMGRGSLSSFADKMCREGITDSAEYLRKILGDMKKEGQKIGNISLALEAQKPRLERYFPAMKKRIGEICDTNENNIGLTISSGEGLTRVGRGEGISVCATVLLFSLSV